jgi:hypothetical protein
MEEVVLMRLTFLGSSVLSGAYYLLSPVDFCCAPLWIFVFKKFILSKGEFFSSRNVCGLSNDFLWKDFFHCEIAL